MIKALIFDLDGVIVNTTQYHYLAWKKIANNLGFDISNAQNEQLKGVSRVKSLDLILEWGKIDLDNTQKEGLLTKKNKQYLNYINTLTKADILPGIMDALEYLKSENIAIALGSASKNAVYILEKLEIKQIFDVIIDGNEVQKAKPDPEVFLKAAKKLEIFPQQCIVIEDAKAGIEAANNAKMLSVGIGDKAILNEADYVLKDSSELSVKFLKTLLKK